MKGWKALAPAILLAFSVAVVFAYNSGCSELLPAGWFGFFLFRAFISKFAFIALLLLAAYGTGGTVLRGILPDFSGLLEEFLFKTALGLAFISSAVFLLALAGLVYPAAGFLLIAASLAAGFKEIRLLFRRLSGERPSFNVTLFSFILCGVSFYFLIKGLMGALMPPTGFDVLMYHIGVPKLYLNAHRMFPTPDINGSSFPFGAEMLYLLGLMVDGPVAANLVNYSFAVLGGLAAASFTRRFLPGVSALASFAVYVSVPLVIWLMPQAYAELAMGFYSMLAVHAVLAGLTGKESKWPLMAAVMAGFTMAIKYTGALLVGVLFMAVLVHYLFIEKRGGKGAQEAFKFLLVSAAACLPWYVRNVVYYSNPLYPFMAGVFNGASGYGANVTPYSESWSGGPAAAFHKLAASFCNPTLNPAAYKVGWNSGLGPYFLMFIPGIALFRGTPRPLKYLLWLSLALYLVFLFGTQENLRYMTPVLPALSVLAAYPLGRLALEERRAPRAAGVLLAAVFAFSALAANTGRESAVSYTASGPAGEDEYYERSSENSGYLASYQTWKWIDHNLPQGAVIYQLWDDASVYFRTRKTLGAPLSWGDTGRQKIHLISGFNGFGGFLSGQDILNNLRSMGAGYLLVNANREGHALPEDPYFIQHVRLVYQDKGVFVFQLVP